MNEQQNKILTRLLDEMGKGAPAWQSPFFAMGKCNLTTGHVYTGINRFMLATNKNAYYLTYKQAASLKGHIKKGEKGTTIIFWNFVKKEDAQGETETFAYMKPYTVFSTDQAEIPEETLTKLIEKREIELKKNQLNMSIEDFLAATKAEIKHDDLTKAYYLPSSDKINLPVIGQFKNSSAYYNTALHELTHWTGHLTRLDRKMTTVYMGKENYSKEELIAEIGSSFLSQEFGIEDIERNAGYCESWLKALRNNKSWLFHCASQAEKAVKYLKELVM